eukprot:GHVS01032276.1.p2 GENE.GHVS01032276.1~~GHVS01032276.1.p2  ORF type:complete len:103 (-),score=38.26 GHVS01032276.1:523-831(-)
MLDLTPSHFVVVFDSATSRSSRTRLSPSYKQSRVQLPTDYYQQLKLAIQFCKVAGVAVVVEDGVEADDVIATIARMATAQLQQQTTTTTTTTNNNNNKQCFK